MDTMLLHRSNTDQGAQFTSEEFLKVLKERNIKIGMDGKGRVIDNVFTERLWRSLKYENVFIKGYETMVEANERIAEYLLFYIEERLHAAHGYGTPNQVHVLKWETAFVTVGKNALKNAA